MRFKVCAALSLALLLVAPLGCATIRTNPTSDEVGAVRAVSQDASAGIRIGLGIATQAGALLDSLPLPSAAKTDYDCAIVRVTGTGTPRPNLLTICGPNTPQGAGPLVAVLNELKAVTSRASLQTTLTAAKRLVEPLVVKLETSDQPGLRAFGASLRFAFALVLSGGVQ